MKALLAGRNVEIIRIVRSEHNPPDKQCQVIVKVSGNLFFAAYQRNKRWRKFHLRLSATLRVCSGRLAPDQAGKLIRPGSHRDCQAFSAHCLFDRLLRPNLCFCVHGFCKLLAFSRLFSERNLPFLSVFATVDNNFDFALQQSLGIGLEFQCELCSFSGFRDNRKPNF